MIVLFHKLTAMKVVGGIAMLILILYGRTLTYGLVWDDYVALRPRPAGEITAAWVGPWGSGGVWPDFYRPLSIAVYAASYRAFGHNTTALHALNLVGLGVAALLLSAFVRRETRSARLGFIAAGLLIIHPETPASLAAWISQQFHLAALLCVLAGLLTWQRLRGAESVGPRHWLLILVPLTLGLGVKEDVLMVAPTLLAWQWIRRATVGDVSAPSRGVMALVAGWMLLYAVIRTSALGAIGGYDFPGTTRLLLNIIVGPLSTFGMQWIPSAHLLSIFLGVGLLCVATLAWRGRAHASGPTRAIIFYGLSLGLIANLPLILVSGHTRVYLLILASTLTITGAVDVAMTHRPGSGRAVPRVAMAGAVAWALLVMSVTWIHTNTFAPCAPETRQRNTDVLAWDIVSPDVKHQIAVDLATCGNSR